MRDRRVRLFSLLYRKRGRDDSVGEDRVLEENRRNFGNPKVTFELTKSDALRHHQELRLRPPIQQRTTNLMVHSTTERALRQ